MAKIAMNMAKYLINIDIEAEGVIEGSDVIGAIFGQTEGLIGEDLELRELQKNGKIGRITVEIDSKKGKSVGKVTIPSSLDMPETSIIAASLETIDKIGPCEAKVTVKEVKDVRIEKRNFILGRAKELLSQTMKGMPESKEISESVKNSMKEDGIVMYKGIPAGPAIAESEEVILVEGRADVINLLRAGIKNAIALDGAKIPPEIAELTKEKITTAFVDGDRGGDLIMKALMQVGQIDFFAKAPDGKEVEELTQKEILMCLRSRVPLDSAKKRFSKEEKPERTRSYSKKEESAPSSSSSAPLSKESRPIRRRQNPELKKILDDMVGTKAACLFDKDMNILGKVPLQELENVMEDITDVKTIAIDGKITQELTDLVQMKRVQMLLGMSKDEGIRKSRALSVLSLEDI